MSKASGKRAGTPASTPKLLYIVTEDWYFLRHRLPMARAAVAAGFEVHVTTRIDEHAARIEQLGFTLHPLHWSRSSTSPLATVASVRAMRRLIKALSPSIIHNVALKPALLGSLATVGLNVSVVNSINGLGSSFLSRTLKGRVLRAGLRTLLPLLLNREQSMTIVQNPEDEVALSDLGIARSRLVLIPGSGVDTDTLVPLPEPPSPPVRAAFVGRMLEDKGVRALIEAHRILRQRGKPIELVLAGTPDPENLTSISTEELEAWAREPGICWLGHVENIAEVWAQSHIAVLPSRREGLPKSLLEAAACARPMAASDAPGCREVAIDDETGYLFPIDDAAAIADCLARLASDREARTRFGARAREIAVSRFSAARIGAQTAALYARMRSD